MIACMIPDFFVMTHLIRYLKISYLLTLKYSSFANNLRGPEVTCET